MKVYLLVIAGSQYSRVPDGMFRKPSEGQSLISYLSEQDFGSCADLEKVRTPFYNTGILSVKLSFENETIKLALFSV